MPRGILCIGSIPRVGLATFMSLNYEEIDFRSTPLGDLMLRRRRMPRFGDLDIYEVKLGEEFLMTSLFHEAEDQLAVLGLKALRGQNLDVVIGGLGLGYTAVKALEDPRISSMVVIDYLEGVIEWHQKGLVPLGPILTEDSRCHLVHADFFALAKNKSEGFDVTRPKTKHHGILLDIDHTPIHVLSPGNSHLYSVEGLTELSTHLHQGGVFALWTDGIENPEFTERLQKVFSQAEGHTIEFDNPLHGGVSTGAVYVATL